MGNSVVQIALKIVILLDGSYEVLDKASGLVPMFWL